MGFPRIANRPGLDAGFDFDPAIDNGMARVQAISQQIAQQFDVPAEPIRDGISRLRSALAPPDANRIEEAIGDIVTAIAPSGALPQARAATQASSTPPPAPEMGGQGDFSGSNQAGGNTRGNAAGIEAGNVAGNVAGNGTGNATSDTGAGPASAGQLLEQLQNMLVALGIPPAEIDRILQALAAAMSAAQDQPAPVDSPAPARPKSRASKPHRSSHGAHQPKPKAASHGQHATQQSGGTGSPATPSRPAAPPPAANQSSSPAPSNGGSGGQSGGQTSGQTGDASGASAPAGNAAGGSNNVNASAPTAAPPAGTPGANTAGTANSGKVSGIDTRDAQGNRADILIGSFTDPANLANPGAIVSNSRVGLFANQLGFTNKLNDPQRAAVMEAWQGKGMSIERASYDNYGSTANGGNNGLHDQFTQYTDGHVNMRTQTADLRGNGGPGGINDQLSPENIARFRSDMNTQRAMGNNLIPVFEPNAAPGEPLSYASDFSSPNFEPLRQIAKESGGLVLDIPPRLLANDPQYQNWYNGAIEWAHQNGARVELYLSPANDSNYQQNIEKMVSNMNATHTNPDTYIVSSYNENDPQGSVAAATQAATYISDHTSPT